MIFWNVENTLRILLKHSKFCSFIKTISLKQKQHVLRTFQFWPKSLYPDLTGVAILLVDFFGWVFQMLKIPFEFFWNIQNFVLSSKQSVWSKNSMFCGLFNFDQNHCIRTLPAWPFCWLIFLVEFFKCWKYPSNSSETFKILFFHQNNQFEAKTACFADFSILTKIAVSGPYRRGHFVGWFFWLIFQMLKIPFEFFWNIQNFVLSSKQSVWSKNSMFCGLFNFDQNRCIRTLPAWPFCWLIFLVEFFKCWKYPSNYSETFKILFFHQNNQFEAKTACFADFSILTKIAVSGPYRRGHFFGWFFENVENTLRILLKHSKCCSFIKTISLKQKQHVLRTFQFWPKSLYPDLTGVAILLVDFFGWFFEMLKIPFEFFWNIQNFVLSSKQSVWSKNSMFCGLFNFDQNHCIRTLPAWSFCWLIFFGWVFQMLKIPFEFFWNIQNFVLSSKQSVWSKNSMFCGLFNFDQNRCIRTLPAWPFCWLIFLVEFFKCWKYPSNSSETFKILFFHQNNQFEAKTACFADFSILTKIAVSGPYRRGHFVSWFFWLIFWNVENTLRILLKHSKFCSFIKTISLKQKQCMFCGLFNFDQNHCIRTLPAWPFCWLIFLVEFFKCWKYPSNSSETFKILFFHQNNQFEAKTACFADFSILTKIAVSGPYRRGHFVGWFFWLSFSNVENTLRILLKHSKFCSFIKTISLKQKQHVLRTFQFWPKSLYPDFTGVAILLVDFFGWFFEMLKIPFEFFWNIQNFVLSSKQSVWSKNSMFCGLFNFDQNRCIRTLPAWPFCWLIFLVEFFKCWKYPSNSSETFKILFFHQNNQFEAKTACFADFSILTKIAVSGHYRRGHFVSWFFWLIFWNVENTLRIILKHSKFCSFIKTISLKQKQHVLRTFQFWPKSLYPDITGVAILLVDFFGWFFEMLKIPFEFFWNIQNFVLSSKQSVWSKNSMFCGLFNFDQNRCIRTLPAWPFCWFLRTFQF